MAKTPVLSSERLALAQAHEAARAAQQALTEAEDAYRQALVAWGEAGRNADEIETQIARLHEKRTYGIPGLRIEQADQLAAAHAALKLEEPKIHPFKLAKDEAAARIPEAQRALTAAQDQVAAAARRVACAEAVPIARACLARLQEAYAILSEAAPDLLCLVDKNLLPDDLVREAETAAGGLLRRASGCSEIEARYRRSSWRVAAEMLQGDPAAALPPAPVS